MKKRTARILKAAAIMFGATTLLTLPPTMLLYRDGGNNFWLGLWNITIVMLSMAGFDLWSLTRLDNPTNKMDNG